MYKYIYIYLWYGLLNHLPFTECTKRNCLWRMGLFSNGTLHTVDDTLWRRNCEPRILAGCPQMLCWAKVEAVNTAKWRGEPWTGFWVKELNCVLILVWFLLKYLTANADSHAKHICRFFREKHATRNKKLLGAPGIAIGNKKLLEAPGRTTRSR